MKTLNTASNRNIGIYVAQLPVMIAAFAILAAWSLGIAALIRKKFDPAIPQWILVIAAAAVIVGALLLIGRMFRTSKGQKLGQILIACLLVPFVATLFGGIYLWIADRTFRGRDPGMTSILGVGLGVTVFGFGFATEMNLTHMVLVFAGSLAGLTLLRLAARKSSLGLMRFGALHFLTLSAAMCVASIENEQRKLDGATQTPTQEVKAEPGGADNG